MTNTIVSIRIPESMVKNLKEITERGHYLDLSEAVRSIVRKKWIEWKDPNAFQIKRLREDIKQIIKEKSQKSREETLLNELERIRELILDKEAEK